MVASHPKYDPGTGWGTQSRAVVVAPPLTPSLPHPPHHHTHTSAMMNANDLVLRALKCGRDDWLASAASTAANDDSVTGPTTKKFRELVSWVEDTKIRLYKVEEREALRDHGSATWSATFEAYLEALECPYGASNPRALNWLLNYALSLEYRDNATTLNSLKIADDEDPKQPPPSSSGQGGRAFRDASAQAIAGMVADLAAGLDMDRGQQGGEDVVATLERIEREAASRRGDFSDEDDDEGGEGTANDLEASLPLGFTTGDAKVDAAALVLRSLFIQDLRRLQSTVDETVVRVQEYTANPKTDAKLGKVGR